MNRISRYLKGWKKRSGIWSKSKLSPELSGLSIVSQATGHAESIGTISARGSGSVLVENSITSSTIALEELAELGEVAELETLLSVTSQE